MRDSGFGAETYQAVEVVADDRGDARYQGRCPSERTLPAQQRPNSEHQNTRRYQ